MKSLVQVSGQLQAIQNSPSLIEVAADRYVKKFEESGTAMLSAAITVFGESSHELRGVSEKLGEQLTLTKGRYVRLKFLGLAGGGGAAIGAVAGVLMALFLPRFLPASAAMTAASTVMGEDRWDAGLSLMEAGTSKDGTTIWTPSVWSGRTGTRSPTAGTPRPRPRKTALPVRHRRSGGGVKALSRRILEVSSAALEDLQAIDFSAFGRTSGGALVHVACFSALNPSRIL